ncbi:MAG: C25 family cysteine peptidase, partial [Candidatus Syntrophosphaera sp.]|nr:C25 family cysteine peptidase [Candidatus Syntrophosphaera sp.]
MFNFKPVKILALVLTLLVISLGLFAQNRQIELESTSNQLILSNNSDYGFDVNFSLGQIQIREVQTKEGLFDELFVEGWGHTNEVGEPKLPMRREMIFVPLGAQVSLTQNSRAISSLDTASNRLLHPIMPAQAPVSKSADLSNIPFEINQEAYANESFRTRDWVRMEEVGIMRGVRVFALEFYPVRYNPVSHSLQVMETLELRVDFENPDLLATSDLLAKTASWEFDKLYSQTLFNWDSGSRTQLVRHPSKMVILCPVGYTSHIQSFVDWKTQQGIAVTVATVGTGGTMANTSTAIKSYMQSVWNAATSSDPAPTYLLIIGDESGTIQVKPNSSTVSPSGHITDQFYVRLNGTDYLPEMYHGRFSVSSTTELSNIINKTITYEKTLMPDLSYLGKTILIAGVDASYASTHGNGAINYATSQYFNSANGITSDNYLYPASGQSAATIRSKANEGRGYINYTAHGSETSWYDPSFTTSHVNQMTNTGKYGVMVGNCCITNWFNYSVPCFGEAVIRKANAGGVAYIGGINSTYWNEDYYWAVGYKTSINGSAPAYNSSRLGAYDALFHTHGEAYSNWATTLGENVFMGNMAVQQSNSSMRNYYWEIYHIMGDPSLSMYFGVPTANNASYPAQIYIGDTTFEVTGAAPYSRVAISQNGVIHGSAITNANGSLSLPITAFSSPGTATLVITAQNRITIINQIPVVANNMPEMEITSLAYVDTNNNIPEYNENGWFNLTYKNNGNGPATNLSAVLSCVTPGITITNASHQINNLAVNASTSVNHAFAISIANDIVNGTQADFIITMTMSGFEPWTHDFSLNLKAPELEFAQIELVDTGNNNGNLDPGETATISIVLKNNGDAASLAGTGTLSCVTPGITILNGSTPFQSVAANGQRVLTFNLGADASIPLTTVVGLDFHAQAGYYTASLSHNLVIGTPVEITLGQGSSASGDTDGCPINVSKQSLHGQSVYTKAELNALGISGPATITHIGFDVVQPPALQMSNYLIRMGHTTSQNSAAWIPAENLTQVWSVDSWQPQTQGWNMLELAQHFQWNGEDNIVVDTAFDRIGSTSNTGSTRYTQISNGYIFGRTDSSNMGDVF